MNKKVCSKCKELKLIGEFYVKKGKPDSWCKLCYKKSNQTYRENHLEKYRHRKKSWRAKNPEKVKKYRETWQEKNEDYFNNYNRKEGQKEAIAKIGNEIKQGRLKRTNVCSNCRTKRKTHFHHIDYNKPLEAIELCNICHHDIHLKEKELEQKLQVALEENAKLEEELEAKQIEINMLKASALNKENKELKSFCEEYATKLAEKDKLLNALERANKIMAKQIEDLAIPETKGTR